MKVIGLTGGIGSGKTTVSDLFEELGIEVVDADVVSRQLTAVNGGAMPDIVKHFGPEAASPDSSMNRKFIRELVFSDPAAKTALENILHPLIRKECQRQLDASQSPYTILSVPLLIESPFWRSLACRRSARSSKNRESSSKKSSNAGSCKKDYFDSGDDRPKTGCCGRCH